MDDNLRWALVHAAGLCISLGGGLFATRHAVGQLRSANDTTTGTDGAAGAAGAGMMIGLAERFLMYGALVAGYPAFVPALLTLKSIVRYPEVQRASRAMADTPAGAFQAEYYLVGTLVSTVSGTAPAVVAMWLAN